MTEQRWVPEMDSIAQLPHLSHSNINEKVYELLKERILSKVFAPGQRLNVREIGHRLGVSRTPLKDALNRLAAEGLIEIRPRSGTYVTAPTLNDIEDLLDVRRVLEERAVELALQRVGPADLARMRAIVAELGDLVSQPEWGEIYQRHVELDRELHYLIVHGSGNDQLRRVWEQVSVHVQVARMRYRRASSQLDRAQAEHEALLAAFEGGDVEGAQRVIRQHIARTGDLLRQDFEDA